MLVAVQLNLIVFCREKRQFFGNVFKRFFKKIRATFDASTEPWNCCIRFAYEGFFVHKNITLPVLFNLWGGGNFSQLAF